MVGVGSLGLFAGCGSPSANGNGTGGAAGQSAGAGGRTSGGASGNAGGGASGASGKSGGADAGTIVAPQPWSPNIVVDQFGYRRAAEKIAVIRSPQRGFDATAAFTPGAKYALIDAHSGQMALEAAPAAWSGGAVDRS